MVRTPRHKRPRLKQNEAAINETVSSVSRRVLQILGSLDWIPLIGHVSFEESDWSEEKAGKAVEEYKHFLALKVAHSDFDHTLLSPGPIIDKVWHMHLLDTKSYLRCCEAICSIRTSDAHFIHHNPASARDPVEQREERYGRTLSEYRLCFRKDPTLWCLPPVEQLFPSSSHPAPTASSAIDVKSESEDVPHALSTFNLSSSNSPASRNLSICVRATNIEIWFKVRGTTPLRKVLSAFARNQDLSESTLRMYFGQACCGGSVLTPDSLGIEDGDELDIFSAQGGC